MGQYISKYLWSENLEMFNAYNFYQNIIPNKNGCANPTFFRLLSKLKFEFNEKTILEIGFNNGKDLLECENRGANIYGLEINKNALENSCFKKKANIKFSKAGEDKIPFNKKFDLIYSIGTVCYLNRDQLCFFFEDLGENVKNDGLIIIQIPENDIFLENNNLSENLNLAVFQKSKFKRIDSLNNPYRFIESKEIIETANLNNLKFICSKRVIESHDLFEKQFRIERFFVFNKHL